jgi:hypothetical protein
MIRSVLQQLVLNKYGRWLLLAPGLAALLYLVVTTGLAPQSDLRAIGAGRNGTSDDVGTLVSTASAALATGEPPQGLSLGEPLGPPVDGHDQLQTSVPRARTGGGDLPLTEEPTSSEPETPEQTVEPEAQQPQAGPPTAAPTHTAQPSATATPPPPTPVPPTPTQAPPSITLPAPTAVVPTVQPPTLDAPVDPTGLQLPLPTIAVVLPTLAPLALPTLPRLPLP